MMVTITVEAGFAAGLKALPPHRRKMAGDALLKFAETPDMPSLRFRALQSKPGRFLLSRGRGDRIVLRKVAEAHFAAVDVGPHDNILRRWNRKL